MDEPRAAHETILAERKARERVLEARANSIATARVVVFLAILVSIGVIVFAHLRDVAWFGLASLVAAFVALVVVHARVHAQKDRASASVHFHERALARMAGKWRTSLSMGERFASETHAYAGDLDVFGRASLFQLLDVTATRYGEEVLAKWLLGEESSGDVARRVPSRQRAVRDLAPRLVLREELAVIGSLVEDGKKPDPRPFVMWAGQPSGTLPKALRIVAVLLPLLTLSTLVAGSLSLLPRYAVLAPFLVSLGVLAWLKPKLHPIVVAASSRESALSRYSGMLALLEGESFEAPDLAALQGRLKESGERASREMASLSRIVSFLDARNNEVFRFLLAPALMWDLWCALALDTWRARAGRVAFGWFRALAELDALSSLAAFTFERPDHAFPEIVEAPAFVAEGLGHPLIEAGKRVANDVTIGGPGQALVVTGSNMSGKSTLLRAIGINVVLANVGAPVCAKAMRLGRLSVATSMRVTDSLDEGTSRFYAELKKLKLVLDLARSSAKNRDAPVVLFLLDEILHGTNTRERLIGARAILRELLAQGAMGAVSTHDLGLGDLESEMPDRVRNVHFEEQVENDLMTFDYRLRPGVVQSSNALRLMRVVGLDVVS